MKINNLSLFTLLVLLLSTSASIAIPSTNKIVIIEIGGDLEGESINAYINGRRIFQTKGVSFRKTKVSTKASIPLQANSFELKVVIGGLKYVFDVKSERNTKCLFWKENETITFSSLPLTESAEHFEKPNISIESNINIRITGAIRGKKIQLYSGSSLIFDEVLDSEAAPLSKASHFSTTDSPFNIKVIIDGKNHSLDIDPSKGTYLDFNCLSESQFILTQYLNEKSVPGLY